MQNHHAESKQECSLPLQKLMMSIISRLSSMAAGCRTLDVDAISSERRSIDVKVACRGMKCCKEAVC